MKKAICLLLTICAAFGCFACGTELPEPGNSIVDPTLPPDDVVEVSPASPCVARDVLLIMRDSGQSVYVQTSSASSSERAELYGGFDYYISYGAHIANNLPDEYLRWNENTYIDNFYPDMWIEYDEDYMDIVPVDMKGFWHDFVSYKIVLKDVVGVTTITVHSGEDDDGAPFFHEVLMTAEVKIYRY